MSIYQAGKIAKAVGAITWAAEGVMRLTGKGITAGYNAIRNKPLYNVDIVINGEVTDSKFKISDTQVREIMTSMHNINGVSMLVQSARFQYDAK